MSEGSPDKVIKVPAWLVRFCKVVWHWRNILFGTIFGGLVLNIAGGLLLTNLSSWQSLPLAWFFIGWHWVISSGVLIGLGLLVMVSGLVARLDAPLSERALRRRYLERVAYEADLATLRGVPQGPELIAPSVHLAEIFIAPQFRLNRPLVDFPLSERELARYRASSADQQAYSPDVERIFFDAEKNWQHLLLEGKRERLDLADVWRRLNEEGAVVIQGYPGMGKSTLMERLTLHFALHGLRKPDPTMPQHEQLAPKRLPILLRLGEYASAYKETAVLALDAYLARVLEQKKLPGLPTFFQHALQDGSCLVMLDGLDEVSDPTMRTQVQEQIKAFIAQNSSNCFLITSRVAGYDQAAFPAYPHFTLAELNEEQIAAFLPRWCRATIQRERGGNVQETHLEREVEQRVHELQAAFAEGPGVHELAENPLLLTLLLVMQQNSIVLPRRRVELYDVVTRTLLEQRNLAKGLPIVPEAQAVQRLGPLAFQMQEENNSFARRRKVEEELMQAIRQEGGTEEQAHAEMERFLQQIRERGGLFVSRVGDYFGFMHRTFQEYFAARYILNQIKNAPAEWIEQLVECACQQGDLWREPFLLAVAYQTGSGRDEGIANAILRALLARKADSSLAQHLQITLLAATAIYEAKEPLIEANLREETARELLACYEQAQRTRDFSLCEQIEAGMQKWLLSLPKTTYGRTPLLLVISQAIAATPHLAQQRAMLTLLAMIARQLEPCCQAVFGTLIPPLLALTGLPAVAPYQPDPAVAPATDFDVSDLALTILSFLGRSGPGGLSLQKVRDYFDAQPEQLRLLACCSLAAGTLITPTVVPAAEENYYQYESAIGAWIQLRDTYHGRLTEQYIEACQIIHQRLLACAEEVIYPISLHLLAMLQRITEQTGHTWEQIWQGYLLEQLNTGIYTNYREAVLFWNTLFPKSQLQLLADQILSHYYADHAPRQRYAERMLSSLTSDLSRLRDLSYLICLRDLTYSIYLSNLRELRELRGLRELKDLSHLRDLGGLRGLIDLRDLSGLRGLIDLSYLLLNEEVIEKAQKALSTADRAQKIDLLLLIQERILHFLDTKHKGQVIEKETRRLAEAVLEELATANADEGVREASLDVLGALPARTAAEVALLQQIADKAQDEQVQHACAYALQRAQPLDETAWGAIEQMQDSPVQVMREAAQAVIKLRKVK